MGKKMRERGRMVGAEIVRRRMEINLVLSHTNESDSYVVIGGFQVW